MKKITDIASDDYMKDISSMQKKNSLVLAVCATLIAAGPIGWFFIDLNDARYDRLGFLFICTVILCPLVCYLWHVWLKTRKEE